MLAKIQHPRINYISRVIALPLIAITVLAFTLRTKKEQLPLVPLDKKITVVIDAGHGKSDQGKLTGAREGDVYEDDIVLAIAQKIKSLNTNENINIVLTRTSADIIDLKKRVDIANEANADLFISIHTNALQEGSANSPKTPDTGFEVYIPGKNPTHLRGSELLGSALIAELNKIYPTHTKTLQRTVGIYVLNNNPRPSVMIECGYITNAKDRSFITNENNQNAIAEKILAAIQNYAASAETSSSINSNQNSTDQIKSVDVNKDKNLISITYKDGKKVELKGTTVQEKPLCVLDGKIFKGELNDIDPNTISQVNILKDKSAITKYGDEAKNGVIEIYTKQTPLYYVDGKEFHGNINEIDPNSITSVNVLKDERAVAKYGEKGKNGVVEVNTTTTENLTVEDTIPKIVFEIAEVPPSIDKNTWNQFLTVAAKPVFAKAVNTIPEGTYVVNIKFIVNTDGRLSNFKVVKDSYGLGEQILPEFKFAPKWKPALQNGKPVPSFHTTPVTFVIAK
jgi:N-acetylmuramoyl-L-alanine amidase